MPNEMQTMTLPKQARILAVRIGGIGDCILMMPAFRALLETYTEARIDLLTWEAPAQLFKENDLVDETIIYPIPLEVELSNDGFALDSYRNTLIRLSRYLRSKQYDVVLIFHRLVSSYRRHVLQFLTKQTKAEWYIGLGDGNSGFLHIAVDNTYGMRHEAEYYMAVAEAAGAKNCDRHLFFPISDQYRVQARKFLFGNRASCRPIIAMHPGGGKYQVARRWPAKHFAQLADKLYREFNGQFLFLGGDDETSIREQIMHTMQTKAYRRSLSGKENLAFTAAVIEQCDLFIGNDSGLMHMAAAVNTPTIGIFGLTNPRVWGPYTPNSQSRAAVVRLNLPCMPCDSQRPQGCATRDCLTKLQAEHVAATARKMLRV